MVSTQIFAIAVDRSADQQAGLLARRHGTGICGMTETIEPRGSDRVSLTGSLVVSIQNASIPILFIDVTGGTHSVAIANPSFFAATGLSHPAVLGQSASSVFTEITDAASVATIEAFLKAGQPATWELNFRRRDGSTYLASALLHPVRDHTGVHRQHILSFYPHDSKIESPRSNPAESRALYKHAPGFIATSEGPAHRITFANESYRRFVGHRKLEGLTVAEAMPEIAAQGFVAILDRVFQTGVPYRGETVAFDLPSPSGGPMVRRYADFVYEPVRDADLNIVGIFCEGYDVTEHQEAAAALQTLQTELVHTSRVNAMGTMATTLAHELNQPLSAITNYAAGCLRLVDSSDIDNAQVREALNAIDMAAKRAGAIIRTLRDLTDRRVRASESFELKAVVEESINLVRSACSIDTNLRYAIPANLKLFADRTQIQQVVINLLRNGCEAVSDLEQKEVRISAETAADEIVVAVRDTGPGVTAEAAQGIFTWSDTIKEGGMGLGLSISRTIIEAHGGRIWLEDSSDAGSEFRFALPIAQADIEEAAG